MGRWSESARVGYGAGLRTFTECFDSPDLDHLVARIKNGELSKVQVKSRGVVKIPVMWLMVSFLARLVDLL